MSAKQYQVIEDNGGGVYLFVFGEAGAVTQVIGNLEYAEPGSLDNLSLDEARTWEGLLDDPQAAYDDLAKFDFGWQVIADQDGVYPDRMGRAGQRLFQVAGD